MTTLVILLIGGGVLLIISSLETDPATGQDTSITTTIQNIWNDVPPNFSQAGPVSSNNPTAGTNPWNPAGAPTNPPNIWNPGPAKAPPNVWNPANPPNAPPSIWNPFGSGTGGTGSGPPPGSDAYQNAQTIAAAEQAQSQSMVDTWIKQHYVVGQ